MGGGLTPACMLAIPSLTTLSIGQKLGPPSLLVGCFCFHCTSGGGSCTLLLTEDFCCVLERGGVGGGWEQRTEGAGM